MKFRGWFGQDWGAPCCEEDEHIETPIGESCARCREPIKVGDQGVVAPLVWLDGSVTRIVHHLDCYLATIIPHGNDCAVCRGVAVLDHDKGCAYREQGKNCNCSMNPFTGSPGNP